MNFWNDHNPTAGSTGPIAGIPSGSAAGQAGGTAPTGGFHPSNIATSGPRQAAPMPESHTSSAQSQQLRTPATRGGAASSLTFIHPASPFTAAKPAPNRAEDFDALADLFLSELTPAAPQMRTESTADNRRGGAPTGVPGASTAATPAGGSSAGWSTEAPRGQLARIEAVLLGHLPVYAAAWASQYARYRAGQLNGPVVLLRVTGQWVRVELVGAPATTAGGFVETGDLMAALATAIGTEAGEASARAVLLCTTASDEQRLVATGAVQDITLLTGSDEAGTVAAYRVIKNIAASANLHSGPQDATNPLLTGANPATGGRTPGGLAGIAAESRPGFRLVVAGCESQTATTIWRRLADAARTFLGVELELAGSMPQVAGTQPSVLLYDGPLTDSITEMMEMIRNSQRPVDGKTGPKETGETAAAEATAAASETDESEDFFDAAADEADRLETARAVEALAAITAMSARAAKNAPAAVGGPAKAGVPTIAAPESVEAAPAKATPVRQPMATGAAVSPPWLATLGLTGLGLVCPAAPAAVIGRCSEGRLHVAALGGLSHAEHESAIVSLLRASAWCCEHRDLLCHLMGDGVIPQSDGVEKPVLHLLSSSGPLARQSCIAGIDVSLLAVVPAGAMNVAVSLTRSH